MKTTRFITTLCYTSIVLILVGCESTPNRHETLPLSIGQDVEVNYALDVETRKYITGKFVSMNDKWITILKPATPGSNDRREKHFSINLDRVYMIQVSQE
ncbi:MAG: hypothetical protein P1U42_08815 [Phycisphaerales bacterium]|nr:hypothetical protein [Phycisphaerales bacterium]